MEAVIFHVDMDAFFASVEQADRPEYRGKPVIIGAAPGGRGVVSACSYEAREYGVHSAMPISEAYRRCPRGIYLPVRMERYQEVSAQIMARFEDFSPEIQQISVDEAFLDMTGTERLFGPPEETARRLKECIRTETGLNISIGIAPNKFLAKIASDFDKPDGLYRVLPGEEEAFLDQLELKDLWGIGSKTLERLREYGITSVAQLRDLSGETLRGLFGRAAGDYMYNAVRGIDPGILPRETKSRSVSGEHTFAADTRDREAVHNVLLELSHEVMFRLMKQELSGRTVVLKLRYDDFSTSTVRSSLRHPVHSAEELYGIARELLNQKWERSKAVRLIGIGMAGVEPRQHFRQGELFTDEQDRKKRVEETVLSIKSKGGKIQKASLLHETRRPDKASGEAGEGDYGPPSRNDRGGKEQE
jgi:DNA polymerase-4